MPAEQAGGLTRLGSQQISWDKKNVEIVPEAILQPLHDGWSVVSGSGGGHQDLTADSLKPKGTDS